MTMTAPANPESVFTYGAPQLKFGPGASDEIGFDLSQFGVKRVLVITDPGVAATGHPQRVADQMAQFGIEAHVFDGVHVEPTDVSLTDAVEQARASGPWDAYVAVGGGSGAGRHRPSRSSRWWPCRRPPAPARRAPPSA